MQDSQLLLRDGTTDLTATLTGSYVPLPKGADDLIARIIIPTFAEASDKVVITFTYSDDGTNAGEVVTLPDITYAKVVTNKVTEYFTPLITGKAYVKITITVTDADSGGDFNAGKVMVGIVPAGRYNKMSSVL